MKAETHPNYVEMTITCSTCGTVVNTHGTVPAIRIDLCSQCHPFYTGKQRIVDTAGRVDRFNQRRTASEKAQKAAKSAATKRAKKDDRPTVPDLTPAELAPENANVTEGATSVGENV
jgi:large subunit ribosomal protein L31